MMAYTYIIKNTADITQAMVDVCQQTSIGSLRNSTDGRSILKWQGSAPAMFSSDTKYTSAQIKQEKLKPEWNPPNNL